MGLLGELSLKSLKTAQEMQSQYWYHLLGAYYLPGIKAGTLYSVSHLILKFSEAGAIVMAFQIKKIRHRNVK